MRFQNASSMSLVCLASSTSTCQNRPFHEPPYTEPYVRWCGVVWEDGELAVNSPPTRYARLCPECHDGWLVGRKGRYGLFLVEARGKFPRRKAPKAIDDNRTTH